MGRRTEECDDDDLDDASSEEDSDAAKQVRAQALMNEYVAVLFDMFSSQEPVLRLDRGSAIFEALHVFGDASGLGFGSPWVSGKDVKNIGSVCGV